MSVDSAHSFAAFRISEQTVVHYDASPADDEEGEVSEETSDEVSEGLSEEDETLGDEDEKPPIPF